MSPVIKKPKEKFHIPSKYVLMIVSALCVLLLVLTYSFPFATSPFKNVSSYLIVPFQNGISAVGDWMIDKRDYIARIKDLQAENEELKTELSDLKSENTELQQNKYELSKLRKLYTLDAQYQDYDKTGARIIAKDSGNWYHSFLINKGETDGLAVDMNVIADDGLVGRVTSVGPHWARVISIINDDSNVSAQVLSTSDNMIVSGSLSDYANGVIDYSKLTDNADQVTVGDKVVTSNISDKYLPGILIGYISSINKDANNLTKSGQLTPAVDFEHLDTVLVILEVKETISDEDTSSGSSDK
jgi:rod shape-determining protein MreC